MDLSNFEPIDFNFDLEPSAFNIKTDVPSQSDITAYAEQQRKTSTALDEILTCLEKGELLSPNGQMVKAHPDCVNKDIATTLFYLTHKMRPILTLETGFIYGFSATVIMCAHEMNNLNGGHVPIQVDAHEIHHGIGAYTLERFGFTNFQLMEHESSLVMPQMLIQNLAPDLALAFINGSKRFDEIMLEIHYVDLLLQKDGVIAVNANNAPATKAVVDYMKNNKKHYTFKEMDNGLVLFQKTQDVVLGQDEPYVPFKTDF